MEHDTGVFKLLRRDAICGTAQASKWKKALNLIDLVVLACALVSPGACHEYHLLFQSAGSLRTCTMHAQPYLAEWIEEHPGLRVARWHCAWPNQEDQKI
jgi:hypothetical protein